MYFAYPLLCALPPSLFDCTTIARLSLIGGQEGFHALPHALLGQELVYKAAGEAMNTLAPWLSRRVFVPAEHFVNALHFNYLRLDREPGIVCVR